MMVYDHVLLVLQLVARFAIFVMFILHVVCSTYYIVNIVYIYRVGQKMGPQTHDHNCLNS